MRRQGGAAGSLERMKLPACSYIVGWILLVLLTSCSGSFPGDTEGDSSISWSKQKESAPLDEIDVSRNNDASRSIAEEKTNNVGETPEVQLSSALAAKAPPKESIGVPGSPAEDKSHNLVNKIPPLSERPQEGPAGQADLSAPFAVNGERQKSVLEGERESDKREELATADPAPAAASSTLPSAPVAPKYMVDLYNKFSTDRYSHPMANIVRSFMNINEETSDSSVKYGNNTRVHTLVFNITSISRDEEMYLAELRLFTLVEADRNEYHGVDRRVSVYQLTSGDGDAAAAILDYELVSTKELYGRHSGWETFTVTDAVKQWVKGQMTSSSQVLEVRIDSVTGSDVNNLNLDIDTRPHNENEPLLVVFSNDKKKKKTEQREMHEIMAHEYTLLEETEEELFLDSDDDYEDYYFEDYPQDERIYKRDTERVAKHKATNFTSAEIKTIKELLRQTKSNEISSQFMTERKTALSELYKKILNLDDEEEGEGEDRTNVSRQKRSKKKRRERRRRYRNRICRRKPMYVNFQDINWHTWIIAPTGYEAFKCVGRCYFPLSDHLTPTKHAIIQTLLSTNYPRRASQASCVPTKLDPISILYIDEKGVVTYKYKYDGMVVAECGCR